MLVGTAAGIGVWVFKKLIGFFQWLAFEQIGEALAARVGGWTVFLVPVLGGLAVGLIAYWLVGEERHHGVAGIMESVALAGGRLRYKRIPAKAAASALSIGSGASVGPEDPSVQIGANIGSMFGQWVRLSDERMRALVAGGAAAGVAAAFNAPIAGVFFAMEIVLGEISGGMLGTVVIAAVASAVLTQAVSGAQPAFRVPAYAFHSAWELPLYLGLGLIAGPIAALYVRLIYRLQDLFNGWAAPRWLKPAIAGLAVGLVGIFLPQVFGVGYETIEGILAGNATWAGLLVILMFAKLILTPVSIGGGFMGGVFAPALYLGAALGAAYGLVMDRMIPVLALDPPAFAMVGMAAVLAGAVHAPLTAIILLFEMTNDYHIILPLMFAVAVSLVISQLLQRDSVYTLGLARKGIRLDRGRDVEVLQAMTVGEVMQTDRTALGEDLSLAQASEVLLETHHHGLPVVNAAGELVGILTVGDIDRALQNGREGERVGEVCTRNVEVAFPDQPVSIALRLMSQRDVGRLPVVERDHPARLAGVLRRSDVIRAYDVALTRRATLRHQAHQVRLGAFSPEGVSVSEVVVDHGAPCAGKRMKEIAWPHDCVIASLRRGQEVMIPRGDTIIRPGDVLVAVAYTRAHPAIQRICKRGG